MRHGWQMCHLLVNNFGETGKIEARKLLERRSWHNNRLLGSFNVDVDNWVDFFTYTEFVDRDGKFQLNMLSTSAFAPLARSMGPMLREEGFHIGTGHMGLQRIVKAGRVPRRLLQKYINKWLSTAYDLFGKDSSSSAEWFYVWGLKGRYDERPAAGDPDQAHLNELSREHVQAGSRQAARVDQPATAGRRATRSGAPDTEVPPGDRRVRRQDLLGDRRAADRGRVREAPRPRSLPNAEEQEFVAQSHAGAGLDRSPRVADVRDVAAVLRRALLTWFDREKRSLPGAEHATPTGSGSRRSCSSRPPSPRSLPDSLASSNDSRTSARSPRPRRTTSSPRGPAWAITRAPVTCAAPRSRS